MKKLIINLGVLALAFSNIVLASNSNFSNQQQDVLLISRNNCMLTNNSNFQAADTILPGLDIIVVKPYQKSIEDIVNENNYITESEPMKTAYLHHSIMDQYKEVIVSIDKIEFVALEKTIDQIIAEDSQIINNEEVVETVIYSVNYQKTIEEIILEDSIIIDSKLENEIVPLDLEKIKGTNPKTTNNAGIATLK